MTGAMRKKTLITNTIIMLLSVLVSLLFAISIYKKKSLTTYSQIKYEKESKIKNSLLERREIVKKVFSKKERELFLILELILSSRKTLEKELLKKDSKIKIIKDKNVKLSSGFYKEIKGERGKFIDSDENGLTLNIYKRYKKGYALMTYPIYGRFFEELKFFARGDFYLNYNSYFVSSNGSFLTNGEDLSLERKRIYLTRDGIGKTYFVQSFDVFDGSLLVGVIKDAYYYKEELSNYKSNENEILFGIIKIFMAILLITLLLSSLMISIIGRRFYRDLGVIILGLKNIINGEYNKNIFVERDDELELLAKYINMLAKKMKDRDFVRIEESKEMQSWNENLEGRVIEKRGEIDLLLEELKSKNRELLKMGELKDEFLANTSHELKTPLNGIIGIAESLRDGITGKLSVATEKNLGMIIFSGKRLSVLVDDILDFSKLKNSEIVLKRKEIDIKKMVENILMVLRSTLKNRDMKLINGIYDEIPLIYGDEDRIQQILYNIIGNAIKFGESGDIKIRAERYEDKVIISIKDNGVGIAEGKSEELFKPFVQEDSSIGRNYGGTGLGLSITKKLIDLHQEKIWLESKLGIGTTFFFTMPIAKNQFVEEIIVDKSNSEKYEISYEDNYFSKEVNIVEVERSRGKILIVDDEEINLNVLRNYLSLKNYTVFSAFDGIEALEVIERESGDFDVVILDIMMPKMSGYEVCEEVRKKYSRHRLPILMVTAKHRVEEIEFGLSIGANDYLPKPFEKRELIARVETLVNLSKSIAKTVSTIKSLEEEKQQRLFAEKMSLFTEKMSATLFGEAILKSYIESLGELVTINRYFSLEERDGNYKTLVTQGVEEDGNELYLENRVVFDSIIKNRHLLQNQTLFINAELTLTNVLMIPVIYRDNLMTVVCLELNRGVEVNHLDIINSYSGQVAIALKNAELFKETNDKKDELREVLEKLKAIEKMIAIVHKEKDRDKALNYILNLIVSEHGLLNKRVYFFNYIEKNGNFTFDRSLENEYEKPLDSEIEIAINLVDINIEDDNRVSKCLKERKILYSDKPFIDKISTGDYILFPVYYEKNDFGVLVVERHKDFNRKELYNEIDFLKIFVNNIAIYLENYSLERENLKNEKLTTMMKLSKAIVHELRTPLSSISGFAAIARKKLKNDKKLLGYMDTIMSETKRVDMMAHDLLEYANINEEKYVKEKIELSTLIREVVELENLNILSAETKVEFELEEGIVVLGDRARMTKLFSSIVKNSIEAVDILKKDKVIKISSFYGNGFIAVTIFDNGIGMSNHRVESCFEPLMSSKIQGTGLGLSIAKGIVERHRGSITIDSKDGESTEVVIKILDSVEE